MIVAARRRRRLSLARLAVGALTFLAVLVSGAALAVAAWELLLSMHPESALTLHFPDFEGSAMAVAAIFVVAAVAFVSVAHLLSRWIGAVELAAGALTWLAVLGLALAFFEPLFSAVALWPLFGGVAALKVEDGAVVGVASLLLLLGSLLPQLLLITGRVAPEAEDSNRPSSGAGGQGEGVPVRPNPSSSGRLSGLSGDVRGRDA